MEFNPSKCQVIRVTTSRTPFNTEYILHSQVLEVVTSASYLGVDISSNLSWNTHMDRVTANANRSLGFIKRHVKTKSPKVREMAYQTLVRPQLEYASAIWDPHTKRNTYKVERSKDVQPVGLGMITPRQQVSLHCCMSWTGRPLKRDGQWPVSASFIK